MIIFALAFPVLNVPLAIVGPLIVIDVSEPKLVIFGWAAVVNVPPNKVDVNNPVVLLKVKLALPA